MSVTSYTPSVATNLVAAFKLEKILPDDRQWSLMIQRVVRIGTVREMWGITGRPAQFKVKTGGQFEYFYIIISADGLMFLVAEYAYEKP